LTSAQKSPEVKLHGFLGKMRGGTENGVLCGAGKERPDAVTRNGSAQGREIEKYRIPRMKNGREKKLKGKRGNTHAKGNLIVHQYRCKIKKDKL